ncbi:MAG: ABC transporter substrate-binding protein [Bacteroidota bacterium]
MKFSFNAIFLISTLFFYTSCKKPQQNILVAHIVSEPDDMHPTNGASAIRAEIQLYTHMSLLRLNYKDGTLIPCLAKSLPAVSANGLEYIYELKEAASWDDKSPITGNDIAFTAKASKCLLTNNPAVKSFWDNITEIKVDASNPKKFTVVMKRPYILNTWFWTDFPIIQEVYYDKQKTLSKYTNSQLTDSVFIKGKTDIESWAKEFNSPKYYTDPNFISGAGPYKISKWDKGVSLTLEKKKDHWTQSCNENWYCQAYPDKIIFKLNNNNASTLLELKNKLIDISTQVDFSSYFELSKDENFKKDYSTQLANTYNYIYVCMNMKPDGQKHKKIFSDVTVRRAMAMLTPYDQINKTIYENNVKRMVGPVATNKAEFNTALKTIDYNIEKAKQLLAQAGWADTDNDDVLDKMIDGEKVKLEFDINFMNTQKQWEDMAKQIAESMQKAKIYAKLNPLDYSSFVNACFQHDFDMSIGAWQGSAQPEDYSQLWSTASWNNNALNFAGFGNAQTDALIDSINSSVNEPKRIALSKQFQQIIYDEQPYVFMFAQTRRVIVNKRWENLEVYAEYPGVLLNTLKLKD